jgi:hypothetical protein
LFALTGLAALAVAAMPATAQAEIIVQVGGGGTGLFIDPSVTPTDLGLTTNFGVGLTAYDDGTAEGHFTCLIPGIVVVDGHYDSAVYDEDTGIVTASGSGVLYFPSFEPLPVDFTNTFKAGGPGVGVFTLYETSGYFDVPPFIDTEIVIKGNITIRVK